LLAPWALKLWVMSALASALNTVTSDHGFCN